jgi:hypothetical protein
VWLGVRDENATLAGASSSPQEQHAGVVALGLCALIVHERPRTVLKVMKSDG